MKNSQSRIGDMHPDTKLVLTTQESGLILGIKDSKESRGHSIQFCTSGTRSPMTTQALRELFDSMNTNEENMQVVYQNTTSKQILKLFLESDGDIILSCKQDEIEIKYEDLGTNIIKSRESLITTMEEENQKDPIA